MERSLLWIAFVLACLCGLSAVALAYLSPKRVGHLLFAKGYLHAALGLPVVFFLATLPSHAPFAAGQGFGRGYLFGAVAALLAAYALWRSDALERVALGDALALCGAFTLAVAAAIPPVLLMRPTAVDVLASEAIGWFCTLVVLLLGEMASASDERPVRPKLVVRAGAAVGFACLTCAIAALGLVRESGGLVPLRWTAVGLLMAVAVPLLLLLVSLPASFLGGLALRVPGAGTVAGAARRVLPDAAADNASPALWQSVALPLLLLGIACVLAAKVGGVAIDGMKHTPWYGSRLTVVALLGLVAAGVCWWLAADAPATEASADEGAPNRSYAGALAALVLLGSFMVSFHRLSGFGVAAMMLAGWAMLGLAVLSSTPSTASRMLRYLLFGVVLVLYRVFATRYSEEVDTFALADHYAVFGILVGAALPGLLASFLTRVTRRAEPDVRPWRPLLRLPAAAAVGLAVPGLVLALWGGQCGLAVMVGLCVATWLATAGAGQAEERAGAVVPALLAVGLALAMDQWTHHALLASDMTRTQKVHLVEWVCTAIALYILVTDYLTRLPRRRAGGPASSHAPEAAR